MSYKAKRNQKDAARKVNFAIERRSRRIYSQNRTDLTVWRLKILLMELCRWLAYIWTDIKDEEQCWICDTGSRRNFVKRHLYHIIYSDKRTIIYSRWLVGLPSNQHVDLWLLSDTSGRSTTRIVACRGHGLFGTCITGKNLLCLSTKITKLTLPIINKKSQRTHWNPQPFSNLTVIVLSSNRINNQFTPLE